MNSTLRLRNVFPEAQAEGWQKARGDKPGMSLRQYYAGLAMQGLAAANAVDEWTPEGIAERAVAYADALCEELAKVS